MTEQEKFNGIIERTKAVSSEITKDMISIMVITSYLDYLKSLNLVDCGFTMRPIGRAISAICEEFDWKPSDEHIDDFLASMVEEGDRKQLRFLLLKLRDDRDTFLKELADARKL